MRARIPVLVALLLGVSLAAPRPRPAAAGGPERVAVPGDRILVDDGDTVSIRWDDRLEVVRLLGIDAPEVQHPEHDIPFTQPFGEEARGFLRGALAVAHDAVLLRSGQQDPYGRTLGYLLLDGRNVSVLLVEAHLAIETVGHYGDNGLPEEAAAVARAAAAAGPVPFEAPHLYRRRMREVAEHARAQAPAPPASDGR